MNRPDNRGGSPNATSFTFGMNSQDKTLAIIGLGYVGLPLAVEFGKLRPVIGFDLNPARNAELPARPAHPPQFRPADTVPARPLASRAPAQGQRPDPTPHHPRPMDVPPTSTQCRCVRHPQNAVTVALDAGLDEARALFGQVSGPGCPLISARRAPPGNLPAAAGAVVSTR